MKFMNKETETHRCEFVDATDLVPKKLVDNGFWSHIDDFSFGDCNRSLVTAEALARHCGDFLGDTKLERDFIDALFELDQTYVDLEN
jgi:hypothetical protein